MERGEKRREGYKWGVEGFNHAQAYPKGNLYHAVRQLRDETIVGMAQSFGVSAKAWTYRERVKRMYRVAEIMALYEASDLSPEQFMKLLSKIA
jgi:hypothetical protein